MPIDCSHPDVARDVAILVRFIGIYCDGKHGEQIRRPVHLKFCDLEVLLGRSPVLCDACAKLLAHAIVKRSRCPHDPKPACKHCPQHCYQPAYRQYIREVMRYSGWRMVTRGRVDLLRHLLS